MAQIKFFKGQCLPLEMHKVRVIQKLHLLPIEARKASMQEAGFNTFLLQNKDVYLDMLTDSGVNAMSDRQQAAMFIADDSYAGSATYTRLETKVKELFGMPFFLPVHQGRAAEHLLSLCLTRPGTVALMNYHFTTAKQHITALGGKILECISEKGIQVASNDLFKGNADVEMMRAAIAKHGADKIAQIRMEAGTNLIGGQPFSLKNLRDVQKLANEHKIPLVMDGSLLADNLYFIKTREPECADMSIAEIARAMCDCCDIMYFSARKLGFSRGGGICIRHEDFYRSMRVYVPMYEGFLTYGGMSVREMEALTVGLDETMDEEYINQGPEYIAYMVHALERRGVPVVTPPGGLGAHVDAKHFLEHLPQTEYPSGALACAFYIASGVRGMERGTLSEQRCADGSETVSSMELLRLALPRRVFTLSQVEYAIDRLDWLHQNRHLIGGLRWVEEPDILRFFFGRLEPIGDWPQKLVEQFRKDFGDSL